MKTVRISDYTISPYYSVLDKSTMKFLVSSGGQKISILKTYEEAAKLVVNLIIDPWYINR